jgi:hypothetical protein
MHGSEQDTCGSRHALGGSSVWMGLGGVLSLGKECVAVNGGFNLVQVAPVLCMDLCWGVGFLCLRCVMRRLASAAVITGCPVSKAAGVAVKA